VCQQAPLGKHAPLGKLKKALVALQLELEVVKQAPKALQVALQLEVL